MARAFQYLSPFIYPLFPREAGRLMLSCSIKNALQFRSRPDFTGQISVCFRKYVNGGEAGEERVDVAVDRHVPEINEFSKTFSADGYGYVEVEMTADRPLFDKTVVVQGYGLFLRPGCGALTFGSDLKFARDPIIKEIAVFGGFSLLHQAVLVDAGKGIGNSFFLVNPYRQPVVCTLESDLGRRLRVKVKPHEACVQPLDSLVDDGKPASVMLTANNKVTVFDMRHVHGKPAALTNLDHLDFMNGWLTHRRDGLQKTARYYVRRALRNLGISFA
ncbi:hypothetical protein [Ferrovibrio sp.]|uniref:hypothetical protein n=1 Tax=Ferrovibrio sp. TaxID=1917215 RepID=UPI00311E2C18